MKFVNDRIRQYWKRIRDFCVFKILHADDPPHRLALGVAIGIFVTFLPLIGFQMLISVSLAWLFKANKLVGVPLVWISNPLTIVPIYYPCYQLGCTILNSPAASDEWSELQNGWQTLQQDPGATWGGKVAFWWNGLMEFAWPLGVGCLLVASVLAVLTYYVSLYVIRRYRLRRWGQLMPPSLTPPDQDDEARVSCDHPRSAKQEAAERDKSTSGAA